MGLMEALFGDDSSVEKAFELNLQNIAAGVNALNQAGIDSLPLLEKMNMVIRTRFDQMDKTMRADYAQAKSEMLMGLPAIDYQTQVAMQEAMGQSATGQIASGAYGSTIAAQQQTQIAGQAAGQAAQARQQVAANVAGLTAQQAQASASLGQAEMGLRAENVGQQVGLISGLAQAEASMRGGISYQGQRTPGLLETVVAPAIGASLGAGRGWNPFTPGDE